MVGPFELPIVDEDLTPSKLSASDLIEVIR